MKNGGILVVPAVEKGRGGGHLCRCAALVCGLRAVNRDALLYVPVLSNEILKLFMSMGFDASWCVKSDTTNEELKKRFDLILLDRYQTPPDEFLRWKKIAPVAGIDEGGVCRDDFDFLIDMLIPEKLGRPKANISSPAFLIKNKAANHTNHTNGDGFLLQNNIGSSSDSLFKILITFGQEDPSGLGLKTAFILSKMKNIDHYEITLLKGNLNNSNFKNSVPDCVNILDVIPNLADHIHEYDLIVTHYGLTAYEALFAGVPVLLSHPTPYHKKLAKASGFVTFNKDFLSGNKNTSRLDKESIIKMLTAKTQKTRKNFIYEDSSRVSLVELINSFSPQVNEVCPVCAFGSGRSATRFKDRTYRRCSNCGIIYMDRINPPPIEYEKEYFFASYLKQYGKTYLDDFENIKQSGKQRLKIISGILRGDNAHHWNSKAPVAQKENTELPMLLDIGCAYGPFLDAVREEGFSPFGIDPANDAVDYVNKTLGIPAVRGFFPHSSLDKQRCDVITLWYVIEHFQDCVLVLKEIKKLLKPNGILAFSTPSFSGISGKSSLKRFLLSSPADHYTIWSPAVCKKALSLAGFKVKKIVVKGHHPERFPVLGKYADNKNGILYYTLLLVSNLFRLGDTFEVYAENILKRKNTN